MCLISNFTAALYQSFTYLLTINLNQNRRQLLGRHRRRFWHATLTLHSTVRPHHPPEDGSEPNLLLLRGT